MKKSSKIVKTWSSPEREEERVPVPCPLCGGSEFVPHYAYSESNPLFCPETVPGSDVPELVFYSYVRCVHCGLVQINPQPVEEAVFLRYDKNHGSDYLEYEKANEKSFLELQELALKDAGFYDLEHKLLSEKVKRSLSLESENSFPLLLDIGCATGALLTVLKNKGWTVRGVEISGPQAAYCRKQGLEVSTLPLEENHFPGGTFDVVLASHVIEHLNKPFGFVEEVQRILKPGGHFFVTTPNIAGFQSRFFGSRWRSAIFDHLYLFSKRNLKILLEKAGFTVEQVKTWGGLAAGAASPFLKRIFDKLAKPLGFGDVMIIRAVSRGSKKM